MKKLLEWIIEEKRYWPTWWQSLSSRRKFGPTLGVLLYWFVLALLGGLTKDHLVIGSTIILLSLGGRAAGIALKFIFPILLTGIVYDSMRYYSNYIRGEIHVEFPYEFDKRFFGIETAEGRLTPNEWWQKHTSAILDLITGFFYLCFIAIYIGISIYHSFANPGRTRYVTWAFFWVNMLGYSTYYWFPAAPPWYVSDHGLGPAKLDTIASAAGAIRFDELLGTTFFTGMYGRAADVFGAIPSLHVAYPFLSLLFAFQLGSLRVLSVVFYLIMCFSAVYLNHHYILDILWGTTYAVLIFMICNWRSKSLAARA